MGGRCCWTDGIARFQSLSCDAVYMMHRLTNRNSCIFVMVVWHVEITFMRGRRCG